jgi:phosphate-selective porin OprO/OprP
VLVNVLIIDGKLRIVTENDIPPGRVKTTVDGEKGYLFGSLEMGNAPQLVILDKDPREDVEVLLDTATHARFALKDGQIILNKLPTRIADDAPPIEPRGWRAYTPPPIAVPLTYYDGRKWNRFDTRYASGLLTGALVLDRLEWLSQDAASEDQVGNLQGSEGGEIRALRFGVVGRLKFDNPWAYTVFAATRTFDRGFDANTDDDFVWFDYRLDIPLSPNLNLSVGKQKEPISMERLLPLTFLPWQERTAAADSLLQARNFGAVLNGTSKSQRWTWAASLFNNFIDSDTSLSETPTKFVGRATWLPWMSADESNLIHLGAGVRYTADSDVRRYRAVPEFNQSPLFLDTGDVAVDGEFTTNLEAYWRRRSIWLGFEYTQTDLDAPTVGDPTLSGFHLTGSWALTGEMRGYRRTNGTFAPLPVARAVNRGGYGAWELAARYSTLDLNDAGVSGGEMDVYSLGVNWWLTSASQFSLNYRYVDLDRFGLNGQSSGVNVRLLLVLD